MTVPPMPTSYAQAHLDPKGPGDSRPTANQIIDDAGLDGRWKDKVVLITGCSAGLGVETAKALARTGATLFLTSRNLIKVKKALGSLVASDRVHLVKLELDSLQSVRSAASEVLSKTNRLNILIANAGVMNPPEGRTVDGFETQFAVNHLGHFLLLKLLAPLLIASATPEFASRAVLLSSVAHRCSEVNFDNINFDGCYKPWVVYGASKTANLWTANEADRRWGHRGLHVWSVHPGVVMTGLMRYLTEADQQMLQANTEVGLAMKSPEQGAATTVWAATSPMLEGDGGKYLEDCQIAEPYDPEPLGFTFLPGYEAGWAYDQAKEARLWRLSLALVQEEDDQA